MGFSLTSKFSPGPVTKEVQVHLVLEPEELSSFPYLRVVVFLVVLFSSSGLFFGQVLGALALILSSGLFFGNLLGSGAACPTLGSPEWKFCRSCKNQLDVGAMIRAVMFGSKSHVQRTRISSKV